MHADGTFLITRTAFTESFVGPNRTITESTTGHAWMADGGAGWKLFTFAGFQLVARGGRGISRNHIPTAIPIDDHFRYWTYGVHASRPFVSRYQVHLDVRNLQFSLDKVPNTIGRHNLVIMAGFGLHL